MALVVEDGSIVEGAESYASVADADAFHLSRGNAAWTGTDAVKEAALRRATDYLQAVYSGAWRGWRVHDDQPLDWPRQMVELEDRPHYAYLDMDVIPTALKNATAMLALRALSADLNPDMTQAVKSETVGDISVTYDDSSPQGARFNAVHALLLPFLLGGGSSVMVRLER